MTIEADYSPKYIDDLDDLPISGPDDYDDGQKRKSLFHAEAQFELDVNDGSEIPSGSIGDIHRVTILNLATHVLTHAAEDPTDVTLGDMQSGGGVLSEYSSVYLERYNSIVESIVQSGLAGSSSSDEYGVFVNNGLVGDDATTHTT